MTWYFVKVGLVYVGLSILGFAGAAIITKIASVLYWNWYWNVKNRNKDEDE